MCVCVCGFWADFTPHGGASDNSRNPPLPSPHLSRVGPFLAFRLEKEGGGGGGGRKKLRGLKLLRATLAHCARDRRQLLLIPITLWSGIEQGFFGADFTAGFIRKVHVKGQSIVQSRSSRINLRLRGWESNLTLKLASRNIC